MTEVINRIIVVFVEKKRTGKWLVEQIGKAPATISKWYTNASQLVLPTLTKIASILNVDIKGLVELYKSLIYQNISGTICNKIARL